MKGRRKRRPASGDRCGGQPRTYRVSNIRKLETLDRPFRRPAKFSLAAYWKEWARAFEANLLSGKATVKLSPRGLRLLRGVSEAAAEAAAASARAAKPAGWVTAEIPTEGVENASRQLLALGAEAEVVRPAALRARVAEEAVRIARLYGGGPSSKKRR